jgi:hypothetical protein
MKLLNGSYTEQLNRQYQRLGHVFQERFKAILLCICLAILTRKSGIFLLGCGVCSSFAFFDCSVKKGKAAMASRPTDQAN